MSVDLKVLRKQLRHQRRAVSSFQQKQAQQKVLQQLIRLKHFQHAKKIGVYLQAFGEIHTRQIIEYCFKKHKQVYLPMICSMNQQLHWVKITQQQYRNNQFSYHPLGMKEPMAGRGAHVSTLDFLIMPLLACDLYGTRIGMGGGFYDKTLASAPHKPYRLGLAHDFQLIQFRLHRETWDQPLDALLTPAKYLHFKR
ncbi:5-formyltetrahydrofolate cyclo-ligase [Acinetobacter kookii]|uniref:5-formyltetrahydrofolate cyclo-ligase n=1 Tax=Acinetobacter kookii TaxID=1226327 RepID=A0A1G6LBY1_9GAMM|nr:MULTISPECIES: 5-formyltetrahydrofolate cyclo-ligase [Acinetobacter]MCT8088934.1 5-formyltetrahydrofolate cyclo-ligase [Acinetobacter sp. F_3_1]MCT8097090.1 5-formyltetrahydrofolate cyclo-ligase [Acinetobacter sp. C_3_1]MCT8099917.1 5-formyltetrahydrofolate cyclo-ligase [Acinetobacter sp. C_4_1]MCT8134316.1 5-formyltetrahydrofolate cyclo-ligase [Acinetobacter sp. T_3_1]SDC40633.1 5-formyltetrahydrofolate cyclo-ligase [Acinetobacter kookii]